MNKILRGFDPRAKLFLTVFWLVIWLLPLPLTGMALYFLVLTALAIAAFGCQIISQLWQTCKALLLIIALLTPLFYREGRPLIEANTLILLTENGAVLTVRLLIRITGIGLTFMLLSQSTDNEQILLALLWYGLPFTGALVVVLSLRAIPQVADTLRDVQAAHKLRRHGRQNNYRQRLSGLRAVLISVVIQTVKRIPILAMALEARGLGASANRSALTALPTGKKALFAIPKTAVILVCLTMPLFVFL